jgi:hypothetical protein
LIFAVTKTIHTQHIQTFPDGSELTFDDGSFDSWCVYLKKPGQQKYAPTDVEYFTRLKQLGAVHGHEKIYSDFITFYTPTSKNTDAEVLALIRRIAASYHNDSLEMEILFVIIYAGMVAEENKQFAILKKRVKRLGMHQTLIDKISPAEAANFSKGKKWKELDEICRTKGF